MSTPSRDNERETNNPDVVRVDEVIEQLAELGLPVQSIAQSVGATTERVQAVVTYHRPNVTPEEAELADDLRRLTQAVVRKAFVMLEFGPTEQKLAIIKSVLGSAARTAAAQPAGGHDALKVQFESLMQEVRDVPSVPQPQPHALPQLTFVEGVKDAPTPQAAPKAANDQDEVPRDEEVRFGFRPSS